MQMFIHSQNPIQKQGESILAHKTATQTSHRQDRHQRTEEKTEDLEPGLPITTTSRFEYDFSAVPARSLSPGVLQTKLTVNQPGDKYEREADRISEQVMQIPETQGTLEKADGQSISTQPDSALPSSVQEVSRDPGEPLPPASRAFMEPRFRQNFAHVRVHTNPQAVRSAEAVNALAYTTGNHIIFGAGQYAPTSSHGQRLLAHELAHVVQQTGDLHGSGHGISRMPIGLARKTPKTKDEALKFHEEDQRLIAGFLDNARKIKPDPKKDYRDPDNLYYNTVGLLDGGKLTLTVLSPTHSHPDRHFDTRKQFDAKGKNFGGDYSRVPVDGFEGVLEDKTSADGKVLPPSSASTTGTGTMTPKTEEKIERVPYDTKTPPPKKAPEPPKTTPPAPTAQAPAAPAYPMTIAYFTRGSNVTEGRFRNTFVHEGQHVADMSPQTLLAANIDDKIQGYKTEFRAFWIQPPIPREKDGIALETPFPEPTEKADNTSTVKIAKPDDCKFCKPANASTPSEVKTEMKNKRQEQIFRYIMKNYPDQQYNCCYVYNEKFYKAVNAFAYPTSVNLINSNRIMNLNLEIPKLKLAKINETQLVPLLAKLEPFDWKFLDNPQLSKPFWDALKASAPESVTKAVAELAKNGAKAPFSKEEVIKALK